MKTHEYRGKLIHRTPFGRWQVVGMDERFGLCVFRTLSAAKKFLDRNIA